MTNSIKEIPVRFSFTVDTMILNSSLCDCQHNSLPLLHLYENGVPAIDATAKLAKKQAIAKQALW